jgi:hypothetical protein
MTSLIYGEKIMPSGKYLIMISPVWNDYAEESPDYKRIFV